MFNVETDKEFYFDEQWGILEPYLHQLKRPDSDVVFEASANTIHGYREKLHVLIFKYGVRLPTDEAYVSVSKQIDEAAKNKLSAGHSTNPEGLKLVYYYTLKNWAAARGMPPLQKRRFNVPYRAGTEYVYSDAHIKRMIEGAGNDRDAALVAVAASTGLRRKEIRYIRIEDLEKDGINVKDHSQQLKTKSERFAPYMAGAGKYVEKWLSVRSKFFQQKGIEDNGWLFIMLTGKPLSEEAIYPLSLNNYLYYVGSATGGTPTSGNPTGGLMISRNASGIGSFLGWYPPGGGGLTSWISIQNDGQISINSGTGYTLIGSTVWFYCSPLEFTRSSDQIVFRDHDAGEDFARFRRVGSNDWRLDVKQGGSWVTK